MPHEDLKFFIAIFVALLVAIHLLKKRADAKRLRKANEPAAKERAKQASARE